MQANNNILHTGSPKLKTVQISAKITERQLTLANGRQAVNYLLHGEPSPPTFDRDLENNAALLSLLLAKTGLIAEVGAEVEVH